MSANENLSLNNKSLINKAENNLSMNKNLSLFSKLPAIDELSTNRNLLFFSSLFAIDKLQTNDELPLFRKIKFRLRNNLIYYVFKKEKNRLYISQAIKQEIF